MEREKPCILIIEDDEYSREAIEHLLNAKGCETISAAGGIPGDRAARRSAPDLIVLDLMLPDIDGQRLLRKFRSNRAVGQGPIIAITRYVPDRISAAVV